MLNKQEMSDKLLSIGLKRKYKPYNDEANSEREPDKQIILLEARRPAQIVDGELRGCEIDVYDDSTIRVWTNQKQKAKTIAAANQFKIRLLDGEAELYIPADRADEFLHGLGAKVRATRTLTQEQRDASRERMAKMHQARKTSLATTS